MLRFYKDCIRSLIGFTAPRGFRGGPRRSQVPGPRRARADLGSPGSPGSLASPSSPGVVLAVVIVLVLVLVVVTVLVLVLVVVIILVLDAVVLVNS